MMRLYQFCLRLILITLYLIKYLMKFFIIIVLFIFSVSTSYSEYTPRIEWQKTFGGSGRDEAEDLLITQSGDYIVLGRSTSSDGDIPMNKGNVDVCLMKISSTGQLLWQKTYGGSDVDYPYSIVACKDKGYIISGFTWSTDGDISNHKGERDCWILKLDSLGNMQWEKTYGGSGSESAHSVRSTRDGGYIFAGWTNSEDGDVKGLKGQVNYWVVKINSFGEIEWQKVYGGNARDEASSIQQVSDGYIIAGRSSSQHGDMTKNKGDLDYWIVKIDSLGTIQWQKNYGGYDGDYPFTIHQTHDGGYIIGGTTWSKDGDVSTNRGMRDFWVVKIDKYGSIIWEKVYGGTSTDYLQHVEITSDKGYIITGWTDSEDEDVRGNKGNFDIWVLKIDSVGNIQWQKTFGGNSIDQAYCIRQTSDNGYIIAGWTLSDDGDITQSKGAEEFWLIKLQSPISSANYQEINNFNSSQLLYNRNEEILYLNYIPQISGDYSFTLYSHESTPVYNLIYKDIIPQQNYYLKFATNYLPSGTYFLVIQHELFFETKKCIIVH